VTVFDQIVKLLEDKSKPPDFENFVRQMNAALGLECSDLHVAVAYVQAIQKHATQRYPIAELSDYSKLFSFK